MQESQEREDLCQQSEGIDSGLLKWLLGLCKSQCRSLGSIEGLHRLELQYETLVPVITPSMDPQTFLSLVLPHLNGAITNQAMPKLSGFCALKCSAAESILSMCAIDCWASFPPPPANVLYCSQFDATLVILIGQSNKYSRELALNPTHAVYCLSDIEQILQGQGSTEKLRNICSITPSNLTEALCPLIFADAIDSLVDSSRLRGSCGKLDAVNECCNQVCQNAVSGVAIKIFVKDNSILHWAHVFPEPLYIIDDFKTIFHRGLSLIHPL